MHQEINIEIIPVEEEKNPMDQELLKVMQDTRGQQLKQLIMNEVEETRERIHPGHNLTAQQIMEDAR